MKNIILAFATVLCLADGLALAQGDVNDLRTNQRIVSWTESDLPAFSIQISASKLPPSDASFAKGLDVVYEFKAPDGLMKYYYGKFATYSEANKEIRNVRSKGFDAAFVVNVRAASTPARPASGKIVTTGGKPIDIDPDKDYVIQVGAYRYPLYISFFENVGEVYEYRLNDKIYRYTTKPIKGSQVKAELAKIQGLGYSAAFVVDYAKYEPYKIE